MKPNRQDGTQGTNYPGNPIILKILVLTQDAFPSYPSDNTKASYPENPGSDKQSTITLWVCKVFAQVSIRIPTYKIEL